MEFKALLFDTRSIQRYIYSGNRLKTNIGASYLVERVFEDVLIDKILQDIFGDEVDKDSRFSKERVDWSAIQKQCAVAYIGGGNALLLFRADTEDGIEKKVVKAFSRELLVRCPGLHIGAAFDTLDLSSSQSFQDGIDRLYKKLKQTQATVFPQTNVPYTGLTLSCEVNGEAANYCDTKGTIEKKGDDGPRFFSQETAMKAKAAKNANARLRMTFIDLYKDKPVAALFDRYEFPLAFDELGQKRNETRGNYYAIVHVDGNNMGEKFRKCSDMEDRRRLAMDVQNKTAESFAVLLEEILQQCENGRFKDILDLDPREDGELANSEPEQKRKILPIRPLILGGDDVTFICPAKVAVSFTKRFMEILLGEIPEPYQPVSSEDAKTIDSCAGIAILPTSYPFFRGYELAEQLCDAAKRKMRTAKEPRTAWLDFAILHGEQAPTLEQIREREYAGERGPMHFGPYRVGGAPSGDSATRRHHIDLFMECVQGLHRNAKKADGLPKSKIKDLRRILQRGKDDAVKFIAQMKLMGQNLPKIEGWDVYQSPDAAFWNETGEQAETPYVDAIEMMDFIPKEV